MIKVATLILISIVTTPMFGQTTDINKCIPFEVNRMYPSLSITKEDLKHVKSLIDINERYDSSWVKTYISSEITTQINGETIVSKSSNDQVSKEQLHNMLHADLGSEICSSVQYIPDNNLKNNDIHEMKFCFIHEAENQAKFKRGEEQLKQYIKENAIDKIVDTIFQNYDLATITFSVNENGDVINPEIHWSSDDESTDKLLLETICNMPKWEPGYYDNGQKVIQDFALSVGNMENCSVNMLNLRKD